MTFKTGGGRPTEHERYLLKCQISRSQDHARHVV